MKPVPEDKIERIRELLKVSESSLSTSKISSKLGIARDLVYRTCIRMHGEDEIYVAFWKENNGGFSPTPYYKYKHDDEEDIEMPMWNLKAIKGTDVAKLHQPAPYGFWGLR